MISSPCYYLLSHDVLIDQIVEAVCAGIWHGSYVWRHVACDGE